MSEGLVFFPLCHNPAGPQTNEKLPNYFHFILKIKGVSVLDKALKGKYLVSFELVWGSVYFFLIIK